MYIHLLYLLQCPLESKFQHSDTHIILAPQMGTRKQRKRRGPGREGSPQYKYFTIRLIPHRSDLLKVEHTVVLWMVPWLANLSHPLLIVQHQIAKHHILLSLRTLLYQGCFTSCLTFYQSSDVFLVHTCTHRSLLCC